MEQPTEPKKPPRKPTPQELQRVKEEVQGIREAIEDELRTLKHMIRNKQGRVKIFGMTDRDEVLVIVTTKGITALHVLTPVLPKNQRYWGCGWEVQEVFSEEALAA